MSTGPHAPVSNLVHEAGPTGPEEVSPPFDGSPAGVVLDAVNGAEQGGLTEIRESAQAKQAPPTAFPDVGVASFQKSDVVLETVHGKDNRRRVLQTDAYPFRATASLLITAADGSQWIGTGWFISPRTLITAGHCVYIKGSPVRGRDGWVKGIEVMPGRDESRLPFGSQTSSEFWTVRGWADDGDQNYDYGAIIVPTDVGATVGALGFANLSDAALKDQVANITGYPGDKPGGQMFHDSKALAETTATKVHYDIDTAGGQSGAAAYIVREGRRLAVAIHAYGGATTNSGTRISAPVFANLTSWKV